MANSFGTYFATLLFSFCLQEYFLTVLAQDCTGPLGLTDGTVKNSQLSALSYYEHFTIDLRTVSMKPEFARLNNHLAWCGNGKLWGIYIAVDFLQTVNISAIATQGFFGINKYYVQTYKVKYSTDGTHWQGFGASKNEKVWMGNHDDSSIVKNTFPYVINARYVRVYPLSYSHHACIRMELYGCRNDTSKKTSVPGSTPTVLTLTLYNKSRTSSSPQPPTAVLQSPGRPSSNESLRLELSEATSNTKPGGASTVLTPTAITSSHRPGKETTMTPLNSSTDQAVDPFTEPSTEHWTFSPTQHQVNDGQIAQSSDKEKSKSSSPGTVTIVLIVVAAVLIIIGVPLVMLAVFRRHKRDKRKLCQNGTTCSYDVRLGEVDTCLYDKEIGNCAVTSAAFGTDELRLLDGIQPCTV